MWQARRRFIRRQTPSQIRIPPGWYHSEEPLAPWLSDPHEILSIATTPIAPIDAPGNQAACPSEIPKAGVDAIGTRGIYVWLGTASRTFAASPIPRPTSFARAPWNDLCPLGDGAVSQGLVYEDAGREIVVSVVIGAKATRQQRTELYSMLDSMQLDRPPNPPGLSPQECIAGNKNIDTIPGLAAGSINQARTFGVVPGRRGVVTFGQPTPVGDYLKIVWVLRNPPATDHIEIIGHSLTTGTRVQWATVLADDRVVAEPRLVEPTQGLDTPTAKDPWVSFPAAVLFPSDGCYQFTAQLADGTEIGRLQTYYSRTRSG